VPELRAEIIALRRHYSRRPFVELQCDEVFARHSLARADVTLTPEWAGADFGESEPMDVP
jgi:hypothetical protein